MSTKRKFCCWAFHGLSHKSHWTWRENPNPTRERGAFGVGQKVPSSLTLRVVIVGRAQHQKAQASDKDENSGGGWYAKSPAGSIGSEEPLVGSARSNPQPHGTTATRAITLVSTLSPIHINTSVDTAASKVDSDKSPLLQTILVWRFLRTRVICQIEIFASHACGPPFATAE